MNNAEKIKNLLGLYVLGQVKDTELIAAIDEMQAEIEGLSKDARRYQWLRNRPRGPLKGSEFTEGACIDIWDSEGNGRQLIGELADEAIDEALQPEPQERAHKAIAELQKEAQERGYYGRGDVAEPKNASRVIGAMLLPE